MTYSSGSIFFGRFEKHPKDFVGALRVRFRTREVFGSFEKRTPGPACCPDALSHGSLPWEFFFLNVGDNFFLLLGRLTDALPLVLTSWFSSCVVVRLDISLLLSCTTHWNQSARSTPEYFERRSLCTTEGTAETCTQHH